MEEKSELLAVDLPRQEAEGDEEEHPLKAGIDAAKDGDTASLEDVLGELE